MTDPSSFTKLVPGFDFLQSLVKNAGAALPGIGQWVAPTIDPAELEKRIDELRTVQFWLEQNARMLGATIQAMEVQRMTLSTLKTMNVQMGDLRDSLQIRVPTPTTTPTTAPTPTPSPPSAFMATGPAPADEAAPAEAGPPGAVDPLQWWGALTKQFTELAATAMKDNAANALKNAASTSAAVPKQPSAKKAAAKPGTKRPARKKASATRRS